MPNLKCDAHAEPRAFAKAGSVVPGAGTWKVGFCVQSFSASPINDNDRVNGFVQVTG